MMIFLTFLLSLFIFNPLHADTPVMSSQSKVDWQNMQFISSVTLNTEKAGIVLPSGKPAATERIRMKLPLLIKDPLLSLCIDSNNRLGDLVFEHTISFDELRQIILSSKMSNTAFKSDGVTLATTSTVKIQDISKLLVKQKYPYSAPLPIETVPSRSYSGIIIDARGELSIHGEYTKSFVTPCFFPKVWNESMDIIFEKDMTDNTIAKNNGIAMYGSSSDERLYRERIGNDPLYIKAVKVFGRNRTDPIISDYDALRIFSVKENRNLLKEGKVVILLDNNKLSYALAAPKIDKHYYTAIEPITFIETVDKTPDVKIVPHFDNVEIDIANLQFKPDSSELLPIEKMRIANIAKRIKETISKSDFTILLEGHTADVGKPLGQMNLSIERTQTIKNELIAEGIPESLFTVRGFGGTQPVASNSTEEGRKQNRRVKVIIQPKMSYTQTIEE